MPTEARSIRFGDFCNQWLTTVGVVRLKPSAYREYSSVIRRHLQPALGDLPLADVSVERIQTYIARKIESGLAPRSVDNHTIVLKAVLGTAVGYGLLAENPVDKVARPRAERTEMRFLTPPELHQLIQATEPSWRLLIALAGLCGLRVGEIKALQWSDIDTDAMTLSITKSMRAGVLSTVKTLSSKSTVPLPESLLPLIEQRRRQAGGHKLLFCRRDGSPISDSTPARILNRALVAAHLPSMRFHDLRHSWAVAHLRAGTDVRTLAALGRWSSPSTLVETYSHVIGIGGDAVRRFDEFMSTTE